MKISHVLRGEEHLSNTGKQLVLYEALGWTPPQFGHLSIILNKAKQKLSKRDPETSQWQLIKQLREKGYLPPAIVNYLLLLGWHPKSNQEIFSLSEATNIFNLERLNASGAIYDLEKLNWFNNYYIQQLNENEFAEYAWKFLAQEYNLEKEKKEWVKKISLLFRPQLNCFSELISLSNYFFTEPVKVAFEIPLPLLEKLPETKKKLTILSDWKEENIQQIIYNDKKLLPWLRLKLTGKNKGPELHKTIYLLGKELVSKRLD